MDTPEEVNKKKIELMKPFKKKVIKRINKLEKDILKEITDYIHGSLKMFITGGHYVSKEDYNIFRTSFNIGSCLDDIRYDLHDRMEYRFLDVYNYVYSLQEQLRLEYEELDRINKIEKPVEIYWIDKASESVKAEAEKREKEEE